MLLLRLAFGLAVELVVFGALLFVPAGTLRWWRGWVFLAVFIASAIAMSAWLYRRDRRLLEERIAFPVQRDQPVVDRVILVCYVICFLAWLAFIPLDVFRIRMLPTPGVVASSVGLLLLALGLWLVFLPLRENTFASPVIKHQTDRGQHVVDTGVYSKVRHPMYAGFVPLTLGIALWLESWAAVVLAAIPVGVLVARIGVEERFLKQRLEGYEAYTRRVRYRLIPHVW